MYLCQPWFGHCVVGCFRCGLAFRRSDAPVRKADSVLLLAACTPVVKPRLPIGLAQYSRRPPSLTTEGEPDLEVRWGCATKAAVSIDDLSSLVPCLSWSPAPPPWAPGTSNLYWQDMLQSRPLEYSGQDRMALLCKKPWCYSVTLYCCNNTCYSGTSLYCSSCAVLFLYSFLSVAAADRAHARLRT